MAAAIYSLGTLAFREGDYDQAVALHREALALREVALPAGHSELAASFSALASALAQAGDGLGLKEALGESGTAAA